MQLSVRLPKENVVRGNLKLVDVVILLGGRLDDASVATGSSKVQTVESVGTAGAEVQKGMPSKNVKIQRLSVMGSDTSDQEIK